MSQHHDVVIVGAGHSGAQTAIALRQAKFNGTIALVGAEPELPYERPPLSKDFLHGELPFERMLIRPADFWHEHRIDLICGCPVISVDAGARRTTLANDLGLEYGKLVWAAGGSARRIDCPGGGLAGVHTVRTKADVVRMHGELGAVTHVVIVGGGFIGLEAAATLRKLGKQVTVLEFQSRVLARVTGEMMSRFYEAEHRTHGVDVRLNVRIERIEGAHGRVVGVQLADGTMLPAQMVIVGIGITPSIESLLQAGAQGSNGVIVDASCRTNLPDVFAIGDCALQESRFADGAQVRIESVQNAMDQATAVARHICGAPATPPGAPWFWSNQYDLRLQTIGLSTGHDAVVLRGDPASRHFSLVYLRAGQVVALDCMNTAADCMQGRALVSSQARIDPARLADAATPLKTLATR